MLRGIAPAQRHAGGTLGGDAQGVTLDGGGVGEGISLTVVHAQITGVAVEMQALSVGKGDPHTLVGFFHRVVHGAAIFTVITEGVTQYVSSQGITGNLNKYIVGE